MDGREVSVIKKIVEVCQKHADRAFFLLAICSLLCYAGIEIAVHLPKSTNDRTILARVAILLLTCLLFYLGGVFYARRTSSTRVFRLLCVLYLILYLYLLLTVTLMEKGFGRGALIAAHPDNARAYYLQYFVNFQPFRSIWEVYILGLVKGYVAPYYVLLNLLGNVCALMPLSILLPRLFPAQRRWFVFLPTVVASVLLIELLQFLLMVGSCDVDDLILNAGGALLLYFLLRIPVLARLTERLLPR